MKNKKFIRYLRTLVILLVLCGTIFIHEFASATGNVVVSVAAPADTLNQGQQFTVNITVEPNNAIAGMQFDLSYDPDIVTVNSITEGNLLSQGGADTYFNSGEIDNVTGTVTGVFGAIISPGQTVATVGTFAIITMTAGSAGGSSPLTLSNVVIGDIASQPLPVSVINDNIDVAATAPDTPPSGGDDGDGGGGGGGGSGGSGTGITTVLTDYMDYEGQITTDTAAISADGQVVLNLSEGTKALNKNGQPLIYITIEENTEPTELPANSQLVCLAYDITPKGTTFDPPALLNFRYSEAQVPDGVNEENMVFVTLKDGIWVELEGTVVDAVNNVVTVPISHLSLYTLVAYTSPASFEVTDFTVFPVEVYPYDDVTVSATITNTGDLAGSLDVILTIDNEVVRNQTKTLEGGSSETITFSIVADTVGEHQVSLGGMAATFIVKKLPAAAAFEVSELKINPVSVNFGEKVNISVLINNTGDLSGTYPITLYVDDEPMDTREVTLDGGGNMTLSFSFSTDAVGEHTVNIGDLQGVFEVTSLPLPPVPELPDEVKSTSTPTVPELPALELRSFSTSPDYDEITNTLVSVRIEYQMNQSWLFEPDARLMMTILHNGEIIEQIPLFTLEKIIDDGKNGELNYIPSAGWIAGEYNFRVDLYNGENVLQDTLTHSLVVTPEAVTKMVSWWTLGAVIGIMTILIMVLLAVILYRRRDMLKS